MRQGSSTNTTLVEFLQHQVYPNVDPALVLQELAPKDKGKYYAAQCPRCGKREAYIYKNGFMLRCNRLNKCGHRVMMIDHLNGGVHARGQDFIAAARKLSEIAGIAFPAKYMQPNSYEASQAEQQHSQTQLLDVFSTLATQTLDRNKNSLAAKHLQQRGFSYQQWESFEFGLCPTFGLVTSHLLKSGFSQQEIEKSGVLHDKRWEGRLIGPWRDQHGNVINFWARTAKSATPRYLYLKGGSKSSPFGMHLLQDKTVILTEGIFDTLALQAHGVDNAVGLGGCQLADATLKCLKHGGIEHAIVNFDYDPDGQSLQQSVTAAQKLHEAGINAYVVVPELLLSGADGAKKVDPDLYIRQNGTDSYKQLIANPMPWESAFVCMHGKNFQTKTKPEQDKCLQTICHFLGGIRSPAVRESALQKAQECTSIQQEVLLQEVELSAKQQNKQKLQLELSHVLQQQQQALAKNPAAVVVPSLLEKIHSIAAKLSEDDPEPFCVDAILNRICNATSGKQTGWTPLDNKGIRFHPAELTVIAARTGHGKTTVLLSLLLNWMQNYPQETFVLSSYELPPESILLKLASMLTRVQGGEGWNYYEVKDYLQNKEREGGYPCPKELNSALETLRSWEERLAVVYRPTWNVHRLASYIGQTQIRAGKLGGMLIDYLQLIPPTDQDLNRRDMEISSVARRLKSLSIELDCPVVAAAQIGRQAVSGSERIPEGSFENPRVQEALKKRRPQLHHLREGGSEQEADLVLGLLNYRADYVNDHQQTEKHSTHGPLEINILKNRFGELGMCKMTLEGPTGYIADFTKEH
ncbi:MAG: DnaB-like helicase C-terminal domain-containing protein [Myxococcota bacterium]